MNVNVNAGATQKAPWSPTPPGPKSGVTVSFAEAALGAAGSEPAVDDLGAASVAMRPTSSPVAPITKVTVETVPQRLALSRSS